MRGWKHIKCSVKTKNAEKEWKTKTGTEIKGTKQKIVQNMVDNPSVSVFILKVNSLSIPIKDKDCQMDQKA